MPACHRLDVSHPPLPKLTTRLCKDIPVGWLACLGSTGGGDGSCTLQACDGNQVGPSKCEYVETANFTVPINATSVLIQVGDMQFRGDKTCEGSRTYVPPPCAGTNYTLCPYKPVTGICQMSIDVSTGKCFIPTDTNVTFCDNDSDCDAADLNTDPNDLRCYTNKCNLTTSPGVCYKVGAATSRSCCDVTPSNAWSVHVRRQGRSGVACGGC